MLDPSKVRRLVAALLSGDRRTIEELELSPLEAATAIRLCNCIRWWTRGEAGRRGEVPHA